MLTQEFCCAENDVDWIKAGNSTKNKSDRYARLATRREQIMKDYVRKEKSRKYAIWCLFTFDWTCDWSVVINPVVSLVVTDILNLFLSGMNIFKWWEPFHWKLVENKAEFMLKRQCDNDWGRGYSQWFLIWNSPAFWIWVWRGMWSTGAVMGFLV